MECIKVFPTRDEAELARCFLESYGVFSTVLCDDIGGLNPPLTVIQGAKLATYLANWHLACQIIEEEYGKVYLAEDMDDEWISSE